MIDAELRSKIRRLFFAEHWPVGTIASEVGIHHDTVRRAIDEMIHDRGYRGSVVQLRRHVASVRPTPRGEAYLRLTTSSAGDSRPRAP